MKEAVQLLSAARSAYLVSHAAPDGDSVGSLLGLAQVLQRLEKRVTAALPDPIPPDFAFLPGAGRLVHRPPSGREDLLVVLDSTDPSRLGELCRPAVFDRLPVLNIDHHVTNTQFGRVNIVDPKATSTAELVAGLLEAMGVALRPEEATCLLFGLVADTQGFRTANTTPASLGWAARLLEAGGDLVGVNRQLFLSNPHAKLRLQGEVLARSQLEDGIIWSVVDPALIESCGADRDHVSGIVNLLAQASEAQAAVLFKEWQAQETEVSIRSKPGVDISQAALRLDGGGHPQAAGATLRGPREDVRRRVLEEVRQALRERVP